MYRMYGNKKMVNDKVHETSFFLEKLGLKDSIHSTFRQQFTPSDCVTAKQARQVWPKDLLGLWYMHPLCNLKWLT